MIEYAGLIYAVTKDIKKYLKWSVEDKQIDSDWLGKSGLQGQLASEGFKLHWAKAERVETLRCDGWEEMYEVDKPKRVRRRLVRNGGELVLMGKQE